ncbi:MAG: hypothetical protein IPG46_05555 [Actinobacteria bacterium]|nr:hypothetical protein [Actinomycetota bacterium]
MWASHTRTFLVAAGHDAGAVTAVSDRQHRAGVAVEWVESLPVSASHTRTAQSSPPDTMRVPSRLHPTDRHPAGVAVEAVELFAGVGVPHPHRPIVAARRDAGAVR